MKRIMTIEGRQAIVRYFKILANRPVNEPAPWVLAASFGIGVAIPFIALLFFRLTY